MSEKPPNHALSEMRCPVQLEDVDLFSPGAQEHWFEAYEILHAESPVLRIPGEGTSPDHDGFVLCKYEDLSRVVRDPVRFPPPRYAKRARGPAAARGPVTPRMNAMVASILSLRPTPELWKAHRQQLTDPWVGPRGAQRHEALITRTVDLLIDAWIDEGEVEFVGRFAAPLPARVMTTVLGFPLEDMPRLERWSKAQVRPFIHGRGHRNLLSPEEEAEQALVLQEFTDYVQEQVTRKRAEPGDDMISDLTQVTYPALDRKLSDVEIIGIVYAMHLGGLETTQYALTEQARLLCEHPELFGRLKGDPSQIRRFIEEAMRLRAPTQGLSTRMTTRDEEFQGVPVPAGSVLHLRFGAANLDPEEFACPHALDVDRKSPARHMTFSQGPRSCPGAGISRLEQTIAWSRLLERVDRLELAPGNRFLHQPGIMLGTLELRLRVTRAG